MSKNKQAQAPKKNELSLVRSSAAEYLTLVAASGQGGIEAVSSPVSWAHRRLPNPQGKQNNRPFSIARSHPFLRQDLADFYPIRTVSRGVG